MGKAKGKGKVETEGSSRERSISWDDEQTKFMLDWYIEYKKDQHANFIWKSQHHMKCADALNKEFAMGVTSAQVTRHYRHYKENWKIVETALNKSGNGFDAIKCKLTISESEKATLKVSGCYKHLIFFAISSMRSTVLRILSIYTFRNV